MIGKSIKIRQVIELAQRVSKSNSSILITGESGTGKEMIARMIHEKSDRSRFPFVAINCSAIPDQLLESELFGHRKGSFTGANERRVGLFEEANNGTLFLDEIGDMPIALQAKLLRVLQERQIKPVGENSPKYINVRMVAATHQNIKELTQNGRFREDLYYRLCVIKIHLPPLRERREDIPHLVEHFIKKHCEINRLPLKHLTSKALLKISDLPWRGNVRELENTLERALVLSEQKWIDQDDIVTEEEERKSEPTAVFSKLLSLRDLEREYIGYILRTTDCTREQAADILGIDRKTLYKKVINYGLNTTA